MDKERKYLGFFFVWFLIFAFVEVKVKLLLCVFLSVRWRKKNREEKYLMFY